MLSNRWVRIVIRITIWVLSVVDILSYLICYLRSLKIVWIVGIDDVMRVLRRGRWQRCKISFAESSAEVDDEYDESYEKEDAYDYADDGSCGYPVVVVVIAI